MHAKSARKYQYQHDTLLNTVLGLMANNYPSVIYVQLRLYKNLHKNDEAEHVLVFAIPDMTAIIKLYIHVPNRECVPTAGKASESSDCTATKRNEAYLTV